MYVCVLCCFCFSFVFFSHFYFRPLQVELIMHAYTHSYSTCTNVYETRTKIYMRLCECVYMCVSQKVARHKRCSGATAHLGSTCVAKTGGSITTTLSPVWLQHTYGVDALSRSIRPSLPINEGTLLLLSSILSDRLPRFRA